MLKHVQISPLRHRADSVSLRSTTSTSTTTSCASSMCGSPEPPPELQRTPSRASSYSSLNEQLPQTTIKVYTSCLKIDIEYKTLGIQWESTSKEVIAQLLRRLKMRHRDPRLFYLSMEVSVRRADVKTVLVLDNDTRPAVLQACHPKGESRFCLQLKPGGLIRVHTSALQPNSQYKSLVISEETTSDELLQLLLSCYNSLEPVEQFSIYEVCPGQEYQRKLHPDDIPLRAQAERTKRGETCHFLVRRNPNYARRRQLLAALNDASIVPLSDQSFEANSSVCSSLNDSASLLDMSIESLPDDLSSLTASGDETDDSNSNSSSSSGSSDSSSLNLHSNSSGFGSTPTQSSLVKRRPSPAALTGSSAASNISTILAINEMCVKCRNSYKSCEFCHKNSAMIQMQRRNRCVGGGASSPLSSYHPVYNIREIRTASHSFSSLGNDKKLLDIQLNGRFDAATCRMRPQSVYVGRSTQQRTLLEEAVAKNVTSISSSAASDVNGNVVITEASDGGSNINVNMMNSVTCSPTSTSTSSALDAGEAVNNNPAKGLGHFVYI